MKKVPFLVLGGTGLMGSAVVSHLRSAHQSVLSISRTNYKESCGIHAGVLINCNGNSYRYRANSDPVWDFEASVTSVRRSLVDFPADLYIYISTIDVYDDRANPQNNRESHVILPQKLDVYGFHKWVAERLVETLAVRSVILRVGTLIGDGLRKGPIFDLLQGGKLHMSPESELSLIDSRTVAASVLFVSRKNYDREIFNLTGTGYAKLSELQPLIEQSIRAVPESEGLIYHYNINNQKLSALLSLPTSKHVAEQFIRAAGTRSIQ